MPIVHMTHSLEEVPEGAVNVRDLTELYIREVCEEGRATFKCIAYDTHVGLCLHEGEHNGYHDSDFYMVVWNEEKQQPETYEFASTRGWCGPAYGSRPDATEEVRAKYEAFQNVVRERREAERREAERKNPTWGKRVRVIRGRKLPIGTEGEIFWRGNSGYGESVGLRLADNSRVFTALTNVEVI